MARAAQMVISRFGEQVLGHPLGRARAPSATCSKGARTPASPSRPSSPATSTTPRGTSCRSTAAPRSWCGDPQLNALAYRVHQLTDTPYLTRGEYARVFRLIAEEVNEHGYFLTRTSKAVRDRCIEEGSPIARASVNFILRGITFGGHRFGQNGSEEPLALGACFFRNVVSLCDTAGIALDDQERETLADWILGELRGEEGIGNRRRRSPRGRCARRSPSPWASPAGPARIQGPDGRSRHDLGDHGGRSPAAPRAPRRGPRHPVLPAPRRLGGGLGPAGRRGLGGRQRDRRAAALAPRHSRRGLRRGALGRGAPGAGHARRDARDLLPLLAEDGLRVAVFPSPHDPGLLLARRGPGAPRAGDGDRR